MNSLMLRLARSISFRPVSIVVLVGLLLVLSAGTKASRDLLLFRATENSEQFAGDPGKYDRVSFSPPPFDATRVVYVERRPTLRIPLADIQSVTIDKERFYKNKSLEDTVLEALGQKSKDTSEEGVEYYYTVTFRLRLKAGRQVAMLSHEETFDFRLGSDRLSIGRFTRPAASNVVDVLRFPLIEKDTQRIQAILSPVKDRLTWK